MAGDLYGVPGQEDFRLKTIAFFTTTRAEFCILGPLIKEVDLSKELDYSLFVGGTHLKEDFGQTIQEIGHNFNVDATFDFISASSEEYSLACSLAREMMELAQIFNDHAFDFVCVLGDRFELLPIVQNAILFRKPIIHLHGGELTYGVLDEQVRHMITKAAHLHFVSCDTYWWNVRNMGEQEWRIFNTGALSVDNMTNGSRLIAKEALFKQLNLDMSKPIIILSYHPVTLERSVSPREQLNNIFSVLSEFDYQVMVTAPGYEKGCEFLADMIKEEASKNQNFHYSESLGSVHFQNLLKYSLFILGNSSSGIVEAPFFKTPTVNIGARQEGRLKHQSVVDTDYSVDSIREGIKKVTSKPFLAELSSISFQFGEGHTAKKMVSIMQRLEINDRFLIKKLDFPEAK